jgi:hypothetical protein
VSERSWIKEDKCRRVRQRQAASRDDKGDTVSERRACEW